MNGHEPCWDGQRVKTGYVSDLSMVVFLCVCKGRRIARFGALLFAGFACTLFDAPLSVARGWEYFAWSLRRADTRGTFCDGWVLLSVQVFAFPSRQGTEDTALSFSPCLLFWVNFPRQWCHCRYGTKKIWAFLRVGDLHWAMRLFTGLMGMGFGGYDGSGGCSVHWSLAFGMLHKGMGS